MKNMNEETIQKSQTFDANLTDLERKALDIFRKDEFYEFGIESILWGDVLSDTMRNKGIAGRTFSGVMSSLNKKGYLVSSGTGRDDTAMLLCKGKDYMKFVYGDE